jgi:hypothetical protein
LLALQQAQVGGLHSSSGLGGLRRHGLGGALGFTQGANFGHFGRGRHLLFSGLGQTGLASTLVSTTAPGGAAPVQLTAAASSTIAAPAAMSSTTTATPATADSTQAGSVTAQVPIPQVMVGGATPSGPVVVSGLAGQGMPVPIAPATGWGQAAAGKTSTSSSSAIDPATVEKDFQKLGTDLQAIHDKSQVTPALLAAVRKDVEGLQKESTSDPSQASLATLKTDLLALNGATADFTKGQLQTDLDAAIKSAGVNDPTLVSTLETDLNAVATAMNITPADVQTIQADQKAIATDLGSTAPGDASSGPVAALELPLLGALEVGVQGDFGVGQFGGGVTLPGFAGPDRFLATGSPMTGPSGPLMLMQGGPGQAAIMQSGTMSLATSGQAGTVQGMPFLQGPYGGPWRV